MWHVNFSELLFVLMNIYDLEFCLIVETCGPVRMFLNLNLRSKCCLNARLAYFITISVMLFLEQSVMFILYLIIGSVKNYETFMVKTRLAYLSSPTRITSLFVRICEICPF